MRFEIINPHDPYTMEAPDFLTALTAIALIGEGRYGIRGEGYSAPPALFGDWTQEVYQAAGVSGCLDLFDQKTGRLQTDAAFHEAVAVACDSIRLQRDKLTSMVDLQRRGNEMARALRGKRKFQGIEAE